MVKKIIKTEVVEDDEFRLEMLRKYDAAGAFKKQLYGFMDFIREQGVVGLAVGLTIGTAVTVFVKSIVDNIVNPLIGAILPGGTDLSSKYVCLTAKGSECVNKLSWGGVLSSFISFLVIATIVYFVVRGLKLDRIDKKKP
ncbi:MscL family protein [Candidatus Saccharibacteria bacterium]|nr:MscL family protein [Candidatus Saccharibacteria bacterium]